MDDLVKVKSKNDLKILLPILKKWVKVLREFHEIEEYPSWWFNERATLSSFVGAVWKVNGWVALEEFITVKRGIPSKATPKSKNQKHGRCDLFIANKHEGFAFEAKQRSQSIGEKSQNINFEKAIRDAYKDAGNLTISEAHTRIGLAFIVPYIAQKKVSLGSGKKAIDNRAVRKKINNWLSSIDLTKYDAYAYYFPEECKDFVNSEGYVYPGVLAVLHRRQRGNRYAKQG